MLAFLPYSEPAHLLLKSILSELPHKKTDLSVKRSAKIYSLVLITKLI